MAVPPAAGILEKEQEQSVVQGSIDFGKTIVSDSRYKDLLEKAAQALRIRPHKYVRHPTPSPCIHRTFRLK